MNERVTAVTAYTTLDFVDAEALGHEWSEAASGVVNVSSSPESTPRDRVELQIELDVVGVDRLPTHADRIDLTPEQARTLAEDLIERADEVDSE